MYKPTRRISQKLRSTSKSAMVAFCAASLVGTMGVVAAGSAGASSTKAPFIIAADESLSGLVASYGGWMKEALTGVDDAVNNSGGIDGRKIEVKMLDDQFTLSTAVSNMKKLLTYKPVFATAGVLTTFCAAEAPMLRKAQIPESCFAATNSQLTPVQKYLYDRNPPEETTALPIINFIPKVVTGTPKIAVIAMDIPGPQDFETQVQSLAAAKGWTVSQATTIPGDGTPPSSAQIAAIVASNPNVVVSLITGSENVSFIEALRSDGYTGPFISQESDYAGLTTLKDTGYYQLSPVLFVGSNPTQAGAKEFVSDMKLAGVTGVANLNAGGLTQAWVGIEDMVTSLKACAKAHAGSCSGAQLGTFLEGTTISLPGITSKFGYTKTDHIGFTSQYVYGYRASTGATLIQGPVAMGPS